MFEDTMPKKSETKDYFILKDCSDNSRTTLPRLKTEERLSDDSKSMIRTFETLYDNTYLEETGMPLEKSAQQAPRLTYSALVILLGGVAEKELSRSVYQLIREIAGVDMHKYAFKKANEPQWIRLWGKLSINLQEEKQTLGLLKLLISTCSNRVMLLRRMALEEDELRTFCRHLSKIKKYRDPSAHGEVINRQGFIDFYNDYSTFYNTHISRLMDIKQSYMHGC